MRRYRGRIEIRAMLGLGALLLVNACAADLEFADWMIPVPEGTPVREYAPVPIEGRDPEAVQMIEDLVIGADPGDDEALIYEPGSIVATDDGRIFVADRGAMNIKLFGPDGGYIRSLGQEGQGPGEFGRLSTMLAVGEYLVVRDIGNRRYSIWTLDGQHVSEHQYGPGAPSSLQELADGTMTGLRFVNHEDRTSQMVVGVWSHEGEELAILFEDRVTPPSPRLSLDDPVQFAQTMIDSFENPRLTFDVVGGETLLISPMHEYQLLAMDPQGRFIWALRVAWERTPWPESSKQPMLDSMVRGLPIETAPRASSVTWPERDAALYGIDTDDRGRIYVFLTPPRPNYPDPPEEYPVDVYSADGEFVAAGVVPYRWRYARGDYLYGVRPDPYDEVEVVRYRLLVNQD